VTLTADTEHLIGRSLHVAFVPAEETFGGFLKKKPREIRAFVPVLYVSGPDLPVEDRKGFRSVGKALSLDGDIIEAGQDGTLRISGATVDTKPPAPGLPPLELERWRWLFEQYGAGFRIVPQGGRPTAFFHVHPDTGAMLAIGDTGAGQGFCENNAGDPDLDRLLNGAEALASLASLMGMTGTAIDVWVDIQITFMRKLIAATIVIGGGTPMNDPDIPSEAADRIAGAVEDAVVERIAEEAGVGELNELAGMIGDAAETAQLGACALFG